MAKRLLRPTGAILVSLANFFLPSLILVHLVIHAIDLGIPATRAATILSVGAGVSIPGRIIAGAVADRIGNRRTIMIYFVLAMFAFILLLVAKNLWMLYMFAIVFGLGGWSIGALMAPITAELFGLRSHGTIFAYTALATTIGGAIAPVMAGYIFDITGSYYYAFLICVLVSLTAIIVTIFLRPVAGMQRG